jgi:hypothetical protein
MFFPCMHAHEVDMYHGTVFLFYSTRVVSRYRLFFTECAVSLYKHVCTSVSVTQTHTVSAVTRGQRQGTLHL